MAVPARAAGAQFQVVDAETADELDVVFERMVHDRVNALVINQTPFTAAAGNVQRIAALAAKHRLPAIADGRSYSEAGLLVTYSVDFVEPLRKAAGYVDKILKGAKPGDLPIEVASKYDLIVNLKTARALGITIPPPMLVRAAEVIQ